MQFCKCSRSKKEQSHAANRFREEISQELHFLSAYRGVLKYFNKRLQKSGS